MENWQQLVMKRTAQLEEARSLLIQAFKSCNENLLSWNLNDRQNLLTIINKIEELQNKIGD